MTTDLPPFPYSRLKRTPSLELQPTPYTLEDAEEELFNFCQEGIISAQLADDVLENLYAKINTR